MLRRINLERILNWLVYAVVFLYSVYPELDRDWGWHFKYGEYFFRNGKLLSEDIFSWTLAGYQWVNHSWFYDVGLYWLQERVGWTGLGIVSGIVVTATFWLLCVNFRLNYWKLGIAAFFFIFLTKIGVEQGLRSQVVSLLLFAGLIAICLRAQKQKNVLWLLTPLFLLWVNLHADFVLGFLIATLFGGAWVMTLYLQKQGELYKLGWDYGKYLVLALAVTFINPYTYLIYTQTPQHLGNSYLKNVMEWEPTYGACGSCNVQTYIFYCAVLIGVFVLTVRRKDWRSLPFAIVAVVFFWDTLQTRRFVPVYLVVTFPVLLMQLEQWQLRWGDWRVAKGAVLIGMVMLVQFNLVNRWKELRVYGFGESDYCLMTGCSMGVVDYARKNPPQGRGLNFYDWGGYLIGKNFGAKLFVDGRMHVWQDKNGYQPFADYIEMYYHENYDLFNQYNFDWLLIEDYSLIAQRLMTTKELGVWRLEFQEGRVDYFVRVRELGGGEGGN